jgi:hypothetical protein
MKIITGFGFITFFDYIENWELRVGCYVVAAVVAILFTMYQLSRD